MKQLTFFDLIPEEENKEEDLCETCRYCEEGCCSYNEPLGRYCVLGDAYEFKAPEKDPCETCKYDEDCRNYNIDRYQSCINGSNYISKEAPEKEKPTVDGSDFSEIVEYVEERTGVSFVEDDYMGKRNNSYKCKASKHLTLMLGLSRFYPEVNNGALFISAGFVFQSKQIPYTGSSGPFEDVDKVVEFFNKTKEKYLEPQ